MNPSWQYREIEVFNSAEIEPGFIVNIERERGEDEDRLQRVHQQAAEELA